MTKELLGIYIENHKIFNTRNISQFQPKNSTKANSESINISYTI